MDLDELDARAEAVPFSDSDSSYVESDSDPGLAEHAAVGPERPKRRRIDPHFTPAVGRARAPRGSTNKRDDVNSEDGDIDFRDLEDAHRYLVRDHADAFTGLISRLEQLEEGDDIDLGTGRVVHDHGHLQAFRGEKSKLASVFFDESSEDEDEDSASDDAAMDRVAIAEARRDGVPLPAVEVFRNELEELGRDSLHRACEEGAPLLDQVVRTTGGLIL